MWKLTKEWNSIGHVPFKERDKIYKQYRSIVDNLFKKQNLSASKKKLSNFKSNISKETNLYREREKLVRAFENMKNEIKKTHRNKRKLYFRILKKIMKCRYKKPEFIYLDTKPDKSCLILCNHVGVKGPLNLEFYFDKTFNFRFWGTHEMADGLKSTYKYQSEIYFHQKKGWNL